MFQLSRGQPLLICLSKIDPPGTVTQKLMRVDIGHRDCLLLEDSPPTLLQGNNGVDLSQSCERVAQTAISVNCESVYHGRKILANLVALRALCHFVIIVVIRR